MGHLPLRIVTFTLMESFDSNETYITSITTNRKNYQNGKYTQE